MYLYKKRVDMMQKLIMRIYSFSCDLECRVSSCLTDTQSWTRTRSRIYVSSVECNIGMLLNGAKDSPSHIRMHLCRVFINLVYYENKGIYNNLIQCLRITLFISSIDKLNPIWQYTGTSLNHVCFLCLNISRSDFPSSNIISYRYYESSFLMLLFYDTSLLHLLLSWCQEL